MSGRRGPFGFPYTIDPGIVRSTDTIAWPAVNTAIYARVRDAGPVSKIAIRVLGQGGNISVGVYRNSGNGRSAVPGARVATSGALTCPAIGYAEIALTTPCFVREGDWFGMSCDTTAASFHSLLLTPGDSAIGNGRQYRQVTAHPLPTTPSGLVATEGYTFVLIGVE